MSKTFCSHWLFFLMWLDPMRVLLSYHVTMLRKVYQLRNPHLVQVFCAYWLLSPGIPCLWKTIQFKVVCHTWPWARHSLRRIPWPSSTGGSTDGLPRDTKGTRVTQLWRSYAIIYHHLVLGPTYTESMRKGSNVQLSHVHEIEILRF